MTKHHLTRRDRGWQHKAVVNLIAGILSTVVVGIFVVAKFTEGAWLIVVVFPLLVWGLTQLNKQYRAEASVLEMARGERPDVAGHPRLRVFVFVDSVDLAEVEALRYGKGLHADELTAVHFVIDSDHAAQLQELWAHFDEQTPLRLVDCPDRHLSRTAQELILEEMVSHPDSKATVLLPRRTYSPLLGRLLHDRTADRMARAVSRIPDATAIIVPYDVGSRIARLVADGLEHRAAKKADKTDQRVVAVDAE
jgi:hypothetical protein